MLGLELHGALAGAALLVPALGLGNVGETAVDILLATLLRSGKATRVGQLASDHIANVSGSAPFPDVPAAAAAAAADGAADAASVPAPLAAALELCRVHVAAAEGQRPVFILQQRGAPKDGHHELWAQELVAWAAAEGVAEILVLGVADMAGRQDDLLAGGSGAGAGPHGPACWHIATDDTSPALVKRVQAVGSTPFPALAGAADAAGSPVPAGAAAWPEWQPLTADAHAATVASFLPLSGLGLAPIYYRRARSGVEVKGARTTIPLLVLFSFVSEGDNRPEATALARLAATALALPIPEGEGQLQGPEWWAKAAEGPAFDQALYG